ncbi:hypothetical protein NBM05_01850 [Rothia sp. AR01]|uniref:Plasmid recombination enzyme n=1 Tax=Rothia santali TaxID=2949643 RepID=A0A9X2HAY6_9MICC|nr:hypothetical protein [Rothia santali]MCP3424805.1 hypothetical protein [Rothia santali]
MAEIIGRAGFHAQHTKNVSERGAVLHEMMRELDEDSVAYWAARNPNIVVADEALNEAMVNDRAGGFRTCTDRTEVLDYGADRVRRVKRKFREDKPDRNTGRMKGGTVTTSLLVAHLPKSLCVEIPGHYPVLDSKTGQPAVDYDGQPMMRSRWAARDRDQARRYFQDVVQYLAQEVIPGGQEAVLGYDIQHSESTPHVQVIADTFAEDPKDAAALRVEASRAWFSHREVRDETGRQKSGPAKLRDYHAGLKQHLIDRGYEISADFDEERHLVGMGKDEYGRVMDAKHHIDRLHDRAVADHVKLNDWDASLLAHRHELEDKEADLTEHQRELERREAELPALRRRVAEDSRQEVLATARTQIQEKVQQELASALAPAQSLLDRRQEKLEERLAQAAWDREAYLNATAQLERMSRSLRPLVEKWEQRNPHTEQGAKAQSHAARIRGIEQRAAEIRANAPDPDADPEAELGH